MLKQLFKGKQQNIHCNPIYKALKSIIKQISAYTLLIENSTKKYLNHTKKSKYIRLNKK